MSPAALAPATRSSPRVHVAPYSFRSAGRVPQDHYWGESAAAPLAPRLTFEAGERDAPHYVPLSKAEDHDQRERGERRRRHQEAPLGRVLGPKGE